MAKSISDTSVAELQRQPKFEGAVAASMRGSIELHQSGSLSNWILNDRARAWFGHALLYLHATARPGDPQSGLTPLRIRNLAVEAGICSAGRAAAMLSLMRAAGYLERAPDVDDRRVRRLQPTAKLLDVQRQRLRRQFAAIAIVLPEAQATLGRWGIPTSKTRSRLRSARSSCPARGSCPIRLISSRLPSTVRAWSCCSA